MDSVLLKVDLHDVYRISSGKVREMFDIGAELLIVTTDRISAFDVILPNGIPHKGRVLTALSEFWFRTLKEAAPHHLITADIARMDARLQKYRAQLEGHVMLVRKAKPLLVECVVRGYLTGSGWKDYRATGAVCGIPLPKGLQEAQKLPAPIFTPATKAQTGHDENISFEQMVAMVGKARAEHLRARSLALYQAAAEYALARGIIICDTKFEFGEPLDGRDEILLIDEVLTPDSSRFWPAKEYAPGKSPPSFDKQFVRNYLETLKWDKKPPAPKLPDDIVAKTSEKYLEAYRLLTGEALIR